MKAGVADEAVLGVQTDRIPFELRNAYSAEQLEAALDLFLRLYRDVRYSLSPRFELELAISKLAAAIDIVIYLRSEVIPNPDGTFRKQRWVEEVLVVQPSIDAARGYATTPIFAPNQLGQAVATGKLDNFLAQELARHGFDLEAYKAESQANPGVATS